MDLQDIETLTGILADALREEYQLRIELETVKATVETRQASVLLDAYAEGVIDGSNAEIRKRQEIVTLAKDDAWQGAIANLSGAEYRVSVAEIERRRVEAIISLTRAWLYSQRPTP